MAVTSAEIPAGTGAIGRRLSRRRGRPTTHGAKVLRRAVTVLGTRRLDGRSAVAQAVRAWQAAVTADLGGDLSEAQRTILEGAAQKLILRDSLGDYLMRLPSLVSKKRAAAPVLLDFLRVSDSLARDLDRLGLDRRPKPAMTVAEWLNAPEPPAARTAT